MKKLIIAVAATALCQVLAPQLEAQVSYTPGKNVAFVTTVGPAPLPGPAAGTLLTAQILKGKKKRVLTADATLTSGLLAPLVPWTLSIGVDVNGIALYPNATYPDSIVQDCGAGAALPAAGCTVSGHFIIDIDAAELASPGCCYGVPLNVTLLAGPGPLALGGGVPTEATLAVRMEKKR